MFLQIFRAESLVDGLLRTGIWCEALSPGEAFRESRGSKSNICAIFSLLRFWTSKHGHAEFGHQIPALFPIRNLMVPTIFPEVIAAYRAQPSFGTIFGPPNCDSLKIQDFEFHQIVGCIKVSNSPFLSSDWWLNLQVSHVGCFAPPPPRGGFYKFSKFIID